MGDPEKNMKRVRRKKKNQLLDCGLIKGKSLGFEVGRALREVRLRKDNPELGQLCNQVERLKLETLGTSPSRTEEKKKKREERESAL